MRVSTALLALSFSSWASAAPMVSSSEQESMSRSDAPSASPASDVVTKKGSSTPSYLLFLSRKYTFSTKSASSESRVSGFLRQEVPAIPGYEAESSVTIVDLEVDAVSTQFGEAPHQLQGLRQHADRIVVGMVLVFIVVVFLLEKGSAIQRRIRKLRPLKGAIRLDEESARLLAQSQQAEATSQSS